MTFINPPTRVLVHSGSFTPPSGQHQVPVSWFRRSRSCLFRQPLDGCQGSRGEGGTDSLCLLFCWQPSITPARPPTSSVATGTASPSGGRATGTRIAKMALTRNQSTAVSANALVPSRSFASCSGKEAADGPGVEVAFCCARVPTLTTDQPTHFLGGFAMGHSGVCRVLLILGQALRLTAFPLQLNGKKKWRPANPPRGPTASY